MDHNIKEIADSLKELTLTLKKIYISIDFNLQNINNNISDIGTKSEGHLDKIQEVLWTNGDQENGFTVPLKNGLHSIVTRLSETMYMKLVDENDLAKEPVVSILETTDNNVEHDGENKRAIRRTIVKK